MQSIRAWNKYLIAQIKSYPKLACHPYKIVNLAVMLILQVLELVLCYLKPRLLDQHLNVWTKLNPTPYTVPEALVHLYIWSTITDKVKLIIHTVKCVVFPGCGRDLQL